MKPRNIGKRGRGGRALALTVAILSVGCTLRVGDLDPRPSPSHTVLAEVLNDSRYDMRVSVTGAEGVTHPLGTVGGKGMAVFRLPSSVISVEADLFLVGYAVGLEGYIYRTGPLRLGPGDGLTWTISHRPGVSTVEIARAKATAS